MHSKIEKMSIQLLSKLACTLVSSFSLLSPFAVPTIRLNIRSNVSYLGGRRFSLPRPQPRCTCTYIGITLLYSSRLTCSQNLYGLAC